MIDLNLSDDDIKKYGKSIAKQPFSHDLARLDYEYLKNCSIDELIYIHNIAETMLKKRANNQPTS